MILKKCEFYCHMNSGKYFRLKFFFKYAEARRAKHNGLTFLINSFLTLCVST